MLSVLLNKTFPSFLPVFQPEHERNKDQLFDRIADSYVALFTTINNDVKDKFLSVSVH